MRKPIIAAALPLLAAMQVFAQADEVPPAQQFSTTQMHLQMLNADPQGPQRAGGQIIGRLAGKMLSERFKNVQLGDNTSAPHEDDARDADEARWHLNRRAEVVYDKYRFGLQRGGLQMRYERNF